MKINQRQKFIMKRIQLFKCKTAASLAGVALLIFVNSASSQLTVTGANQLGAVPLTQIGRAHV